MTNSSRYPAGLRAAAAGAFGLAALGVLLAMSGPGTATAAERRPNVVFLFADDMRAESLGALGDPHIKTPHLDRLVERGFVFRNAYCLGGNSPAVCTPSRNMLLSGQAYFRWRDFTPSGGKPGQRGSIAPGDGPNFPLSLEAAGYETYHHGKKGNTAPLIQARFQTNKYLANDEAERRSGEPGKEIVDAAVAFLGSRDANRPFFMYLAFGNPHDPRVAAEPYRQLYDPAALPLPANYLPLHPFDNGEMTIRDEQLSPWPRTPEEIRRTWHEYYATITALDAHVGRLLRALEERGELERTLFVFSADQGISIGSHGLLGKQNLYDAAMKAPLVLAGPGVPHGESGALAYLLDIYPTVCDLVGAEVPSGIDGRSLRPILDGDARQVRESLFLAYREVQRAVRDPRWKLIRYPRINRTQLFDLETDPHETQDLSADPAHGPQVERLLGLMRDWQRQLGDTLPLESAHPAPAAWTPPAAAATKRKGK